MSSANPILIEVTRGDRTESWHRGCVVVVDAAGRILRSLGDVAAPVFPRSSLKPLQALPLLASGAADRFKLAPAEIALACGSHMGQPVHVATAASMLEKAGVDPAMLECGGHWPLGDQAARALAAGGLSPTPLHNNCSGKHAGFLCVSRHRGHAPAGYVAFGHPTMREVIAAVELATDVRLSEADCGTDGCSIPAPALPLTALARGFARLATGAGLPAEMAAAAAALRHAWAASPDMIAGDGCFDTLVAAAGGGAALVKCGAEGVSAAALPQLGLGVAVKIEDGGGRAAEAVTAATLASLLGVHDDPFGRLLVDRSRRPLLNWRGTLVGEIRTDVAERAVRTST